MLNLTLTIALSLLILVTVSGNPNPTYPTTKYRCEFVNLNCKITGLLNRRRYVQISQIRLLMELGIGLVNSDPG